jgi:alanine racemase
MELAHKLPASAQEPTDAETGAALTVDLEAIEANWRSLSQLLVIVECAAVVKADAYGLGLEPVTKKLAAAGCKTFFVADIAEARRARACAPEATIYVLKGFNSGRATAFVELAARPVINSMMELAEWDAFTASRNWRGGAALQVDTGMNRLGISAEEAAALAVRVQNDNHGISLLMSHLACAETPNHPLNTQQIRLFRELRTLYNGIPSSLANSSGIFLGDPAHGDLARPGAALYGINPTPGRPNPMHRVVELTGLILQIRNVERGGSVGYGATWIAKRASRVAVVALGYAEGLMRAASIDRKRMGTAVIGNKRCPFAGRISMDLVCIDITDIAEGVARRGDAVTFIGREVTVDDYAATAGTIGYEILTGLGAKCRRAYRGV